ncbi:ABC transporter ATP-binding protein [Methylobacillus arboreus]|uniref:ABC transporter ATP-binding protein n=1 Tax=Methylobacillus arboreus TaxID=755170 RepID=UPI001E58983E|nr:ATP-binding cassette domain-containing protein [Methylobacillus arboreus]MCB5191505.1 ABC transporter ATP-binding protein [Methylobacillus arboreus]
MTTITVEASELTRKYGGRAAVNDVSFTLNKGEVLGFLGPNGAGKSTTMKMLTGNLAPSNGSVKICGIDMMERPKDAKALIGYLPEQPPLYRELTVDEFLTIAARLHRVSRQHIKKAVDVAKQRCGLTEMGKRLIENLSKGYQQRVGIAQAIIHNPMVVILDEPTVGLDPIQIRDIRALIKELGGEHSVILSTHILPEVEMVCDRVQIIHKGSLVFNGGIDVLKQQRHGNRLLLGLRQPPAHDALLSIPGVESVEALGDNLLRIHHTPGATPSEALVQAAVSQNWGLFQINPDQTSLEEVFVQLTFQEAVAA